MTAPNTTTTQAPAVSVKPVAIVYAVTGTRPAQVTVTRTERGDVLYQCQCHPFALWGDCPHAEAVRAERRKQGRK